MSQKHCCLGNLTELTFWHEPWLLQCDSSAQSSVKRWVNIINHAAQIVQSLPPSLGVVMKYYYTFVLAEDSTVECVTLTLFIDALSITGTSIVIANYTKGPMLSNTTLINWLIAENYYWGNSEIKNSGYYYWLQETLETQLPQALHGTIMFSAGHLSLNSYNNACIHTLYTIIFTVIVLYGNVSTGPEHVSSCSHPLTSLSNELQNASITSEVAGKSHLNWSGPVVIMNGRWSAPWKLFHWQALTLCRFACSKYQTLCEERSRWHVEC